MGRLAVTPGCRRSDCNSWAFKMLVSRSGFVHAQLPSLTVGLFWATVFELGLYYIFMGIQRRAVDLKTQTTEFSILVWACTCIFACLSSLFSHPLSIYSIYIQRLPQPLPNSRWRGYRNENGLSVRMSHPDTQTNFTRLASFIALTKSDTIQRVL
jgi:hypothetical protein